jgi:hypothetical protein
MFIKIVLATVDFNDEAMLHAYEIDDVAFAWRLATKVKSSLTP